ncbi:Pentatricopeptide repeat-containing protein [Quillaja saponaria]|uniref:Pentatricopeptide repeat-containing protein n=1 Tax=Quillaja saponaria TaxID=32244 RepID=A0AAD7KP26_QUISA|nr:Pentatricopeptide repeat-containing protein [Quillaja saponaria]
MQQLEQSKPHSNGSLIPSLSPDRRRQPVRCMVICRLHFRLFPNWKGWIFPKNFPWNQARYPSFLAAANSVDFESYGFENEYKGIDYNFLFHSCTKLHLAKQLHALLVVSGKAQSIFLSARLVNLYAYLGDVSFSRRAFNQIPTKDVYTWNSMVSAYVRARRFSEAVDCYYQFLAFSGLQPDFYTFPPMLKACGNLVDGQKIHCWVVKMGFEWDVFVAASLVHMYSRFGSVDVARKLFNDMPFRDMGSWNAMISGFCQNGNAAEALDVLNDMKLEGLRMDPITVSSLLPVCVQSDDVISGMLIHLYVIKHGLESDLFVSNALINLFSKFGSLGNAERVFDEMKVRDLVSWNSIIAAYEQNSYPVTALGFFKKMQLIGVQPDLLTAVSLASIVGQLSDRKISKSVHGFIMRRGWFQEDVVIGNALVDMYAKLGAIDHAHTVFKKLPIKDVISWNTLITGYAQNGLASEAIDVYRMMQECNEIIPNQGTWVSLLPAYSHVGALQQGMKIHGRVIKNSLYLDVFVGTCLIDMYGKCGRLDDAMSLFHQVPRKSSVPWNTIISCHGIHGQGENSLKLFKDMVDEGVKPDNVTFVSLLSACSHSGLVDEGQWYFHVMQEDYGIKPGLKHYGCVVDLLGRAGYLEKASNFIRNMPVRPDASIWGALLGACRIHGKLDLGSFASDQLLEVDPENVGYYVLMSNIYANVGKWEAVHKVRALARERGLQKTPGWSSIVKGSQVEVFYTGNQTHPKHEEIYKELIILTAKIKSLGYIPEYSFVLQDVEEDEKEHILTSHSERLAIAFGIISTPPRSPIRIFKNLRVCGDCHNATKFISKITEREIVVRDSNRFHHFKDGVCSCGDYW